MVHRPAWFRTGEVFVSFAPTVGINKDGEELYVIDPTSGRRTDVIDDQLQRDVVALRTTARTTETSRYVKMDDPLRDLLAVPTYFDDRSHDEFRKFMASEAMSSFETKTLGALIDEGLVTASTGHGSPSADFRTGTIPYIKVSDLRAGQVNINPTNRVPEVVAQRYWRATNSGLSPYSLLTPVRTSKNIGDFAVLMPGQERVVLTKEILVLQASPAAAFDNFYLLWAMSLAVVRRQWDRVIFMQTNREDVGRRYRQIEVPVPTSAQLAAATSKPFRDYYLGLERLRANFVSYLKDDDNFHVFLSSQEHVDADPGDGDANLPPTDLVRALTAAEIEASDN